MARIGDASGRHRLSDHRDHEGCSFLSVNWGRGRLRRHQSFHSFAATFCALNVISPRGFQEYWCKSFPRDEREKNVLSRIADLLDEPSKVVKTVFGEDRWRIGGWSYRKPAPRKDTLSYCPDCIAGGFHGYFHEDPWLRRCPIHGTELFREEFLHSKAPSRFGKCLECLRLLFERANAGWPVVDRNPAPHPSGRNAHLAVFLRWQDHVRRTRTRWHAVNCSVGWAPRGYQFSHLDIQLGHLAWATPMSEQLSDLFLVKPWAVRPTVHQCHDDLAAEMAKLVDSVHLTSLLWTYRTATLLENRAASYSALVSDAIKTFLFNHDWGQCKCVWGKTRYESWARYESGGIWGSAICPHRDAAEELRSEWLEVFPESGKKREAILLCYHHWSDLLVQRGLAKIVGAIPNTWPKAPLLRFSCTPAARKLFDILLSTLAKSHIEELNHWVSSIEAGMEPHSRDFFPPSVYLVRNSRGIDSVLVWPAGAGRSFEDEATKSWLSGFEARRIASGQ